MSQTAHFCNLINSNRWYVLVTAASCFFGKSQENQGLWELEGGFLYQIYTRKLRIWGCDMVEKVKSNRLFLRVT